MTGGRAGRSRFAGAADILRFNRPMYLGAGLVLAAGIPLLRFLPHRAALAVAIVLSAVAWWTAASLVVSHLVYDRSPLADWRFVGRHLPDGGRWLRIQVGFDPCHGALDGRGPVVDLFDPPQIGGGSVVRARAAYPTTDAASTWPDGDVDAVLAPFSLHEVRSRAERERLFDRAAALLPGGGRFLVVEHVRDAANFVAFGPGFLHFLGAGEWRRHAVRSGFAPLAEERITPFVRAFLLEKQ